MRRQRRRPPSPPTRPTPRPPLAVAITGGIAAGKSETLRAFARHGVAAISADEIVHRLLREHAAVKEAVVERFGRGVLGGDGEIDRSRVAGIVFADRAELAWLEQLLHPHVVAAQAAWREELAQLPEPPAICAVEVPLLYETGGEARFDAVVAVTAPRDVRAGRARHGDVARREERLLPDEEKLARADFAYVNDGSLDELDAFVADVIATLSEASS